MNSHLRFPLLLVFYEIFAYLSNDMYLPALPEMMTSLRLSAGQAQFTLTVWFMGAMSLPLIIGALSDRFGRRVVLLSGGAVYVIASLTCALTTNVTLFLMARFIQGSMVASMLIPGYAVIHEFYSQKQAIRILALMGSIAVLAPALGPLFGSLVLYFFAWRAIFWIIGLGSLITLLLLYRWMPETLAFKERHSIELLKVLGVYRRIILNKSFVLRISVLGLIFSGFIAWITAGPLLVITFFHYSPMMFGLMQAIIFAAYILGNRLIKNLLVKWDILMLIRVGLGIAAAGSLFLLLTAIFVPRSLEIFVLAMMIFAFGSALTFSPLNRYTIEASVEPMGARMAVFSIFLNIFAVIGSGTVSLFFKGTLLSLAVLITPNVILACLFYSIQNLKMKELNN